MTMRYKPSVRDASEVFFAYIKNMCYICTVDSKNFEFH